MEFFVCTCPCTGTCCTVILDGEDQGPNKDDSGNPLTKKCNKGQHTISLQCADGKTCTPQQVNVVVSGTNPISPMGVPFTCA